MLHGETSKHLAPPRNTKDKEHLQSAQTTAGCGVRHRRHAHGQVSLLGDEGSMVNELGGMVAWMSAPCLLASPCHDRLILTGVHPSPTSRQGIGRGTRQAQVHSAVVPRLQTQDADRHSYFCRQDAIRLCTIEVPQTLVGISPGAYVSLNRRVCCGPLGPGPPTRVARA